MKKRLLLLALSFPCVFAEAQTFATTRGNGTTGTCVGCEVQNPTFSVDTDPDTYSLVNLTALHQGLRCTRI